MSDSKQKNVYVYMHPIPNGFRDRAISQYSSKIVDKKEILHTVSKKKVKCKAIPVTGHAFPLGCDTRGSHIF
jgi:hypothetical protein